MLRALAISIVVAALTTRANASLISADFNQGGPGTDAWLTEISGDGQGWDGSWNGDHHALRYLGDYGLIWHQPGYSNFTNDPNQGRMSPGIGLGFRYFAGSVAGTVWLSALVEHTPNPNTSQDVYIGGRFRDARVFFGINGDPGFPSRSFVEFWDPSSSPRVLQGKTWGNLLGAGQTCPGCAFPVHLLVAKLDFDYDAQNNDAVRVWVDPVDLIHGEAGLGVPDVLRDGFDVWSSLDQIAVFLGPGQSVDALRISSAGAKPARLEEVLAPGCGNGTLDEGEECDDGNGANGDCCTAACRFAAAGTVCRPIAHGCDVAETCTGTTATCPADLQLPDVDGDGICDCAIDLDVATHDSDGDGVRDLDDDCVATPTGAIVDRAGCSQAQFCLRIDVSTTAGRSICKRADWRTDEIGKLSRDCSVARGVAGPADDRCGVRDAE